MGERLKGKVAIVTGSGRSLGKAEAMALAAEGAKVVINDPVVLPPMAPRPRKGLLMKW